MLFIDDVFPLLMKFYKSPSRQWSFVGPRLKFPSSPVSFFMPKSSLERRKKEKVPYESFHLITQWEKALIFMGPSEDNLRLKEH